MRSRIINNFLHDTFTGMWFASVIVLYVLKRQVAGWTGVLLNADTEPAAAAAWSAIQQAQQATWWLLLISLVGVTITGIIRLVYWRGDSAPEELKEKRFLLIVKHIAFLVVYGLGSVWAWTLLV